MSEAPSVRLGRGVDIVADPSDPLVVRRSEITREYLREAIRRLSPLERDALRLTTRERRLASEAAAELNVELDALLESLTSGLRSLRRSLLQQLGEGAP